MSEILTGSTDEFFQGILRENLREPRSSKTIVLSIGGLPGSGVTTTCIELARILREQGLAVHRFSSSNETYKLSRERRGTKYADLIRDPQSVREIDKLLAERVLSEESANSIVIADGRYTAFVTKGLKQAGRGYPIPLPIESIGIYLHADEDMRVARKYIEAKNTGITTKSLDDYREELKEQVLAEETTFLDAYPNMQALTPDNTGFTLNGEGIYSLYYSTDNAQPTVTANKISSNEKVQELLSILRGQ